VLLASTVLVKHCPCQCGSEQQGEKKQNHLVTPWMRRQVTQVMA